MKNPDALYYGLVIVGMFLMIALYQTIGRKRSKTWDGAVIDKTFKRETGQSGCI